MEASQGAGKSDGVPENPVPVEGISGLGQNSEPASGTKTRLCSVAYILKSVTLQCLLQHNADRASHSRSP